MSELNRLILHQLAGIKQYYAKVAPRMDGLPMCHPGLEIKVQVDGWCPFATVDDLQGRGLLAGVITPWCINALLLPLVWPLSWPKRTGGEIELQLPAGRFVMLVNEGGFLSLSLLSEPRQLADQQAAEAFLQEALRLLKTPDTEQVAAADNTAASTTAPGGGLQAMLDKPVSRRGILGGS
ncbi:MAG TPA: [NiFe]-hydrogenase assembly, chaperone, HybE [Sulfurivirga caldicuralii]|nr:[NiFe]-hydrogenase assembly, chaperone, HybE [Sulfurivirga caldicuralii]